MIVKLAAVAISIGVNLALIFLIQWLTGSTFTKATIGWLFAWAVLSDARVLEGIARNRQEKGDRG